MLTKALKSIGPASILVLTDDNSLRDCYPLIASCFREYEPFVVTLAAGERSKTLDNPAMIWQSMADRQMDRNALIINLGGGMIGDLGGFCAACYKRGIRYLQIPTTLLAMVDASTGGKTAVNLGVIKNAIGSFHFPEAVLIDPLFLKTLDERQLRNGMAEVLKHGLISDASLAMRVLDATWQEEDFDWAALIADAVRVKLQFAEADPKEMGIRKALNFGHTIGHAFEGVLNAAGADVLHGEAVAAGMICELSLSVDLAGLDQEEAWYYMLKIKQLWGKIEWSASKADSLIEAMFNDKKNSDGEIRAALLPAIGQVQIDCRLNEAAIRKALDSYGRL